MIGSGCCSGCGAVGVSRLIRLVFRHNGHDYQNDAHRKYKDDRQEQVRSEQRFLSLLFFHG
jgi:hypothetical protein